MDDLTLHIGGAADPRFVSLADAAGRALAARAVALDPAALRRAAATAGFGVLLSGALFDDALRDALAAHTPAHVRLDVAAEARDLESLRWECLVRRAGALDVPLAAHPATPFSRLFDAGAVYARAPQAGWPLRVVAAISNPVNLEAEGLAPLDAEAEWTELQRAFAPLRGLAVLERVPAPVSLDAVLQALEAGPAILHFIGHGLYDDAQGRAMLALENGATRALELVDDGAWQRRLAALAVAPRLIVLAACESAARVREGALTGMAPAFVRAGAGAVVAMHDRIGMDAARALVFHFYRRLATHGEIDRALNEARSYLLDTTVRSWSMPTLYLRRGAERVFAAPPESLEAPPAAEGETLILIAEFQGDVNAAFEVRLRDRLQKQIAANAIGAARVVYLQHNAFGPDADDRVAQLAARYAASLVVWGWYDLGGGGFQARFTATDALTQFRAHDLQAVAAGSAVGGDLVTPQDLAVFVQRTLPARVDFFVFFALGVLRYWAQDYDAAFAALTNAIDAAANFVPPPSGLSDAYFYRGNINAFHRQARAEAIADYTAALRAGQPPVVVKSAVPPVRGANVALASAAFNLGQAFRAQAEQRRLTGDANGAGDSYKQALDAYGDALMHDPRNAPTLEMRGLTHWELGNAAAAGADYRAALALAPSAEVHNKLAIALAAQGDMPGAQAAFDAAVLRAPERADYRYNRALLARRQGRATTEAGDLAAYLRLAHNPADRSAVRARLTELGWTDDS
ncbi:MAG: CHAT domain-containing protein [Chloroflexi bacterium]|nr:CHAT domain-containing protein [Chloroflexota bacterium]